VTEVKYLRITVTTERRLGGQSTRRGKAAALVFAPGEERGLHGSGIADHDSNRDFSIEREAA